MQISFSNKDYKLPLLVSQIIMGFFILDIIISFNTGNEDKGIEILDRKSIAKIYLKGKFWFDLIALGSLSYTMLKGNTRLLHWSDIFGFFTVLKISHII